MGNVRCGLLMATALLACAGVARADESVKVLESMDAKLQLGQVTFAGGKSLDLTIGIGSALFHMPGDPADEFYALTDRGPNIDCADSEKIAGMLLDQACGGDEKAKLFPRPDFVPSIVKVKLNQNGTFVTTGWIPLRDAAGKTITGLSNPLKATKTEAAYDKDGKQMPFDPNGLDTEGLVRLKDGTFWIGEEYGPGLVHVAADGKIIERLVPAGLEGDLSDATYTVTGSLPAILMKRHLNRGIEGIAVAPDESALYTIVQNPLANPDANAYKAAVATRILKLDLKTRQVVGEYVYTLDPAESFKRDKSDKQSDVRISELVAVGIDKLIVLERISKTTKLQAVDLSGATNILRSDWDKIETSPSLEQLTAADLSAKGVTPVSKKLWLDSSDYAELPSKIEGVAIVDGKELVLINDDDFGIEGAKTRIVRLTMPRAAF
ncbi:esterase-like activity of phytase family protein [Dongia deserti]|uniref:esterase-like activity of phytase family protein n=1 Tax=Dongia deserti TaxID=2268030 RepID=UPI000E65B6EC|nr:esterase-like activity of phytase family protein [Dongia deserti]